MFRKLFFVATLFVSLSSTAQIHKPAQYNLTGILWQQKSAEYKALCYQAFSLARLRLDEILRTNKDPMPLAIVTDVDETILDNSPEAVKSILIDSTFSEPIFKAWINLAAAKALPGSVEFFNYAAQHGVQCFYITNRSESQKDSTIKNLQQRGFPQVDNMHVMMKSTTSDKEPRRQQVAKTYNIVLLLGDNLNDFDNLFYDKATTERNANADKIQTLFGSKYIVLPNATYGSWEDALWKESLPKTDKDKIRWDSLISF